MTVGVQVQINAQTDLKAIHIKEYILMADY